MKPKRVYNIGVEIIYYSIIKLRLFLMRFKNNTKKRDNDDLVVFIFNTPRFTESEVLIKLSLIITSKDFFLFEKVNKR